MDLLDLGRFWTIRLLFGKSAGRFYAGWRIGDNVGKALGRRVFRDERPVVDVDRLGDYAPNTKGR